MPNRNPQLHKDGSTHVIQKLFVHQDAIASHLAAPMLAEREAYLGKLLTAGFKKQLVADRASTLRYIVTQGWFSSGASEADILNAVAGFYCNVENQKECALRHRGRSFIATARSWAKFLGVYKTTSGSLGRFDEAYREFLTWLREDLKFLDSSVQSCAAGLKGFLIWTAPRCETLSSVCFNDVEAYISERRAAGRSQRTIIGYCQSLKTFFRFIEQRGWHAGNLSKTIRPPSYRPTTPGLKCPPWNQIRRTLALLDQPGPSQCRARAILLLACLYGLRRSEISRLTLEDLDWHNEVLTVRRSKRGKTQQFPIVFELGEAIIRYLKVRPKSGLRSLFLTLHAPYRPAGNFSSAMRKVLVAQNVFDRSWGMHAFRHACATELLRKGTSLRSIADFLGHRGIQSVSIYAHSDTRALRQVAQVELRDFMCD